MVTLETHRRTEVTSQNLCLFGVATGGGRHAGPDAWKASLLRQTCTVNYGSSLSLAQGVRFDVP